MRNFLILLLTLFSHTTSHAQAYRVLEANEVQGIASSQNLLKDGGWEKTANLWTASGGTYARSTSSPLRGIGSATWDSSSAGQTLTSAAVTIPSGLYGANGVVSCRVQVASGTATHTISAYDGSNLLGPVTITNVASGSARTSSNFVFPSSGSIYLRFTSVASNEPSIKVDDCTVAAADTFNVSQVNQATLVGANKWVGVSNCTWSVSSTTYSSYSADTDCNNPTPTGFASAPGTKIPAIVFANGLPPGDYLIVANSMFYKTGVFDSSAAFRFTDGTNSTTANATYVGTGNTGFGTISGRFSYATAQAGPLTIQVQGATPSSASASAQIVANSADFGLEIMVYKYPSASEQAYRPDLLSALWSGYHSTDCLWTTTSTSYVDPSADASCTFTERKSINFGTVASAGAKTPGIVFTPPKAGTYYACANFKIMNATVNGYAHAELTDGTNILAENGMRDNIGATPGPMRICGFLPVAAASSTTLKLRIKISGGGTTNLGSYDGVSTGIEWSIFDVSQSVPMPTLVGSVTSGSTGAERIERAYLNCDSGSAITSQSGSWVSTIGNISSGTCTVTIATGMFSATPVCVTTTNNNSNAVVEGTQISVASATSFTLTSTYYFGAAVNVRTAFDANVICVGPR